MVLISEITSPWWSLSIPDEFEVVQSIEDIQQSINLIIKTEPGSNVLRPTFGSNIFKYIDDPISIAGPNISREIVQSLALWEKRIEVTQVDYSVTEDGRMKFTVSWKLISSDFINVQEIQF